MAVKKKKSPKSPGNIQPLAGTDKHQVCEVSVKLEPKEQEMKNLAACITDDLDRTLQFLQLTEVPPKPLEDWGASEETNEAYAVRLEVLKKSLADENMKNFVLNRIMAEIITAAYQDRLTSYAMSSGPDQQGDADHIRKVQRIRQSSDTHLLRVIQTAREIRQPRATVIIRQTEQVNVADQQQINIDQTNSMDK